MSNVDCKMFLFQIHVQFCLKTYATNSMWCLHNIINKHELKIALKHAFLHLTVRS